MKFDLGTKFENFRKSSEAKFLFIFPFDIALLGLFTYIICLFNECYEGLNLAKIVLLIIMLIEFAVASYYYLREIKHELETLSYSYKNIYLFRKFSFLYNSLIIVSLSFLLGISPSFLTVLKIDDELISFELNTFLIGASCIATATKGTIEYTYTIWDTTHKKKGEVPY